MEGDLVAIVDHAALGVAFQPPTGRVCRHPGHQQHPRVDGDDLTAEVVQRAPGNRLLGLGPATGRREGNEIHPGVAGQGDLAQEGPGGPADVRIDAAEDAVHLWPQFHAGGGAGAEGTAVRAVLGEAEGRVAVQMEVGPGAAAGGIPQADVQSTVGDLGRADGVGRRERPGVPRLLEGLGRGQARCRQDIGAARRVLQPQVGQPELARCLRETEVQRARTIHLARRELERLRRPLGGQGQAAAVHRTPEEARRDRLAVDRDLGSSRRRLHAHRKRGNGTDRSQA